MMVILRTTFIRPCKLHIYICGDNTFYRNFGSSDLVTFKFDLLFKNFNIRHIF